MAKKKSDDQVENVDEPNFEDPEDFVDDVTEQGEPTLVCEWYSWKIKLKRKTRMQNVKTGCDQIVHSICV